MNMKIATITFRLHAPWIHSLKEKRMVVKSLIARREQPDMIILQSRSPSCGVRQRYDGTFSGKLVDVPGVTAELLMENGFHCVDVEDL